MTKSGDARHMDRVTNYLASGRFLVLLLLIAIVVGISFGLAGRSLGGPLLDMISGVPANQVRLAAMTPDQRVAHLWVTLTLDIVYPLAYGGGLANFAARFATTHKLLVAMPGLFLILADLFENAMIVLMLNGDSGVIPLKVVATEVKWGLFGGCSALVLVLAGAAAIRHYAGGAMHGPVGRNASREF